MDTQPLHNVKNAANRAFRAPASALASSSSCAIAEFPAIDAACKGVDRLRVAWAMLAECTRGETRCGWKMKKWRTCRR